MSSIKTLETERLILRLPESKDLEPMYQMNQDPVVMEFMTGLMDREATQKQLDSMIEHWDERGFGTWVATTKDNGAFLGSVGLKQVGFEADFTPAVEVAWRLARPHWGFGYATEGAKRTLEAGFENLGFEELVGFTVPKNSRSIAVFDRIGMPQDPTSDFAHPKLDADHPLSSHIFFRLNREAWRAQTTQASP